MTGTIRHAAAGAALGYIGLAHAPTWFCQFAAWAAPFINQIIN